MSAPLIPPLPGSSPEWKQNVSPSLDFSGLDSTVAAIDSGITAVKNTIATTGDVRKTVLGKAQSWYASSKDVSGSANTMLNNLKDNVGSLVTQTAGTLSKGGVIEQVGLEFTGIIATATASTTQLLAIITGSSVIDTVIKTQIINHVHDLLTGLNTVKDTLLSILTQNPADANFLTTVRAHIETALADLETKVNIFKEDLASVPVNALHTPIEAEAIAGAIAGAAGLIKDPAQVLQAASNYLQNIKFKMISVSPVVGDLNVLRDSIITTLDGNFINTPVDTGVYGAMVLFTKASGMIDSLTEWAKKAILLFGDHKEMSELLSFSLSNPLLSPLGALAGSTDLGSQVKNANIDKSLPAPTMLQQFGTDTKNNIKTAMDTGFLKDLLAPDSPIGKFFSKAPSQTTTDRTTALDQKKVSLLPNTASEPSLPNIGSKETINSLTGLTTDISKLGKNPENKWLDLKGPEDLFAVTGQQVNLVSKIVADISGITPKIRSSVQVILDSLQKEANTLNNIKLPSLDEAKAELTKVPTHLSDISFDVLLLPPADGGLKVLRRQLTDWVKPVALNAPQVADNTAMFAIVILISAPSLNLGSSQLTALSKQFQI